MMNKVAMLTCLSLSVIVGGFDVKMRQIECCLYQVYILFIIYICVRVCGFLYKF